MEFGIQKIKSDKININNSYEYLKTSISQPMPVNDVYNITPIISEITNLAENCRTESLITLSEVTPPYENNICSKHSVCEYNCEKSFTNSISNFLKNVVEKSYSNALISRPQVLFTAPKRFKKLRRKQKCLTVTKRQFQCTRLVRLRIVHFKYKHPEKKIRKKLEMYYNKTKKNRCNPRRIQEDLRSDSVLKAVSLSRILKKVLAKENLLDEIDKSFLEDINQDKILYLDPSDDTLTRIYSESSQTDSIDTKAVPSVIEILNKISATEPTSTHTLIKSETSGLSHSSNETSFNNENEIYDIIDNKEKPVNETIFKTDIISVAVAQINDAFILKYKTDKSNELSQEEMLYKENLTSAESFNTLSDPTNISSTLKIPKKDSINNKLKAMHDDKNCIVLTDISNNFDNSSSDTFVIAKTSSYFKENSDSLDISSNETLTPSSDLTNQTEPCKIYYQSTPKGEEIKSTLLDTIINVRMFEMPIISLENEFSTGNSNNVIITEELGKMQYINKGQAKDKTVIQKSFSIDNEGDRHKNVRLPIEDKLRTILTETEKSDKKTCSEEFRNFIPPLEMWDKLFIYLDMRMRKMEDSLVKKISEELKDSLSRFQKLFPFPIDEHGNYLDADNMRSYYKPNESDLSKMESGCCTHFDEGMQCGKTQCTMVHNEIIDEILCKMKVEGNTTVVGDFPLKLIKSRIKIKKGYDSFEVLKPPARPCTSAGRGKGDSLLTLSSDGVKVKKLSKQLPANHLVMCVLAPFHFFKTNMLVITSVPAFFVSIFLVYKFFVLLM